MNKRPIMYVIIWRHESSQLHFHLDSNGFIIKFATKEDAENEAKENDDGEDFCDYGIYEELF